MILTRLANSAYRAPKRILLAALIFLLAGAVYAAPVITDLPSGGYDVPESESVRAEKALNDVFGAGGLPVVFAVTSDRLDSPIATSRAAAIVQALQKSPYAHQVISYWTAPPALKEALVSADGETGLVVARMEGGDRDAPVRAHNLAKPLIGEYDGVKVTVGGQSIAYFEGSEQSRRDLVMLEAVAVPLTALALIWIFGSLVAASLPLLVAAIAVVGTGVCLWTIHQFTDVSIFAVNLATALGLAFAVDYTLFILSRYREERSNGLGDREALIRTMNTAGRTVIYSGLTMALTIATLFVFTPYLLRSLAYAGIASVGFATLASLCVTPALLIVCGDRLEYMDIRPLLRKLLGRTSSREPRDEESSVWYRIAVWVMRRPAAVLLTVSVVLVALATPLLGIHLAYPDDRALPSTAQSRQTGDVLRAEFDTDFAGTISIVMPSGAASAEGLSRYATQLSQVENVTSVASPGGTYVQGVRISSVSIDSKISGDSAYLTVSTSRDPYSPDGKTQLARIREVPAPAPTLFGGIAQRDSDNVAGIVDKAPIVVGLVALATLLLMFMMTGSVVLPFKALVTNALSLTVAFGVMVWAFQDGHLGGLGTTATGNTTAFIPPSLAVIAYALSMDYEVFVLSRIREEWLRSNRTSEDNMRSVGLGMARTGRIVTAAAVIMAVVFIAIAAGQVSFMRGLGVGLAVSVLVDAFVVRTILVPAAMGVLGRWNWWAPRWLARWHEKRGFVEDEVDATIDGPAEQKQPT